MVQSQLGQLIKDLRESSGLSQKELAKSICSQSEISKIEAGKNIPNIDTMIQIAIKVGVDLNYFFYRLEKPDYDFIKDRFMEIRKAVRNKDYQLLEKLLKKLDSHPLFQNNREKQFLLWHHGIVQYYLYKNSEQSLIYLSRSVEMKKSPAYTEQEIEIINSIGIIYCEEKNCNEGIELLKEALEAFGKLPYISNERVFIRLLYNLAKSYYYENKYEESKTYCHQGIEYCLETETNYLLGEHTYQLGLTLKKMEELEEALASLHKARALFDIQNKAEYIKETDEYIKEIEDILALKQTVAKTEPR